MLRLMSEVLAGKRPPIRLAGHSFLPVAAGALYRESEDTLLVADLHLEKGAAFAARGMMLPLTTRGAPCSALPPASTISHPAGW